MNIAAIFLLQETGQFPRWEDPAVEILNRAAFSFAIVLSVWGAALISRRLESLRSNLSELLGGAGGPMEPFRAMGSTASPVLLTVATAAVFAGQSVLEHGTWIRSAVAGASWLLIGIALWTFFWVYLNLQIGLHRLGRRHLSLEPYPADRSLGLRPLGALAFTGFWTFVSALAPLLLASGRNRLGLTMGVLILLAGVAAFFLSLRRLNRQMVAAKQQELAWARRLYAQAFRPVREEGTLEALQRQAGLLGAPRPWKSGPNASRSGRSTRERSRGWWPSARPWSLQSSPGSCWRRLESSLLGRGRARRHRGFSPGPVVRSGLACLACRRNAAGHIGTRGQRSRLLFGPRMIGRGEAKMAT